MNVLLYTHVQLPIYKNRYRQHDNSGGPTEISTDRKNRDSDDKEHTRDEYTVISFAYRGLLG